MFAGLVIMLALLATSSIGLWGPNPVGQSSNYVDPLIVPAGYAFSIWSMLYVWLIYFPFRQWHRLRKKTLYPAAKPMAVLYSVNVIGNGLWLVFASYDWLFLALITIVGMLYTLYRINDLLEDSTTIHYIFDRIGFTLYFAWITLATVLNASAALSLYRWSGFGISQVTWSLLILIVVCVLGLLVFRRYRDAAYSAVVVWALSALAVRQWVDVPMIAYLSTGIAILFGIMTIYGIFAKMRGSLKI